MQGTVLGFDEKTGKGMISGEDGNRYPFMTEDIMGDGKISRSTKVDFVPENGKAKEIYRAASSNDSPLSGDKNKIVAGLLALFLGVFGIHKFYLGKAKAGVIMLLTFVLGFILLGVPSTVIAIIAFIEAIIYFLKPEDAFQREYVDGDKAWF